MNQLTNKNKIHREDTKTPFVETSAPQTLETADLSVITQKTAINSPKADVIEKYFKSLSPKSRSILYDKTTKSLNERMPFTVTYESPKDYSVSKNTSLGGGDTNAYASPAAITAADEIINSIYTKSFSNTKSISSERVGLYDNTFEHVDNDNDKVITNLSSTTATSADERRHDNRSLDIKLPYRKINHYGQNDVINHIQSNEKEKPINQSYVTSSQPDDIDAVVKRSAFKEHESYIKGQSNQYLLSQELNEDRQPVEIYNNSGGYAQIPQSNGHSRPFVNYDQDNQSAHQYQTDELPAEQYNHRQNDSYHTVDQNDHNGAETKTDFPQESNTLQDIENEVQINQKRQQYGSICDAIGENEDNQHQYEENVDEINVASTNADEKQDRHEAAMANKEHTMVTEESNVQKDQIILDHVRNIDDTKNVDDSEENAHIEQHDQLQYNPHIEYDQSNPQSTENMQQNEYQKGEQAYETNGQDQEQYDEQPYDQQQYDQQEYDQQQYDQQHYDQQQYDQQQYDQQQYDQQQYDQQQYNQQLHDQANEQIQRTGDQDQQQYDQANEQTYGTTNQDQQHYDQTDEQSYGTGNQDQQQYDQQPYDQTGEQIYSGVDQNEQQYDQQPYDQAAYAGDQYYQGEYDQNDQQYYNQQYDVNGHPVQYYDQTGEAVQPNYENGQPVQQEYHNQSEESAQQNYEGTEYAYDDHQVNNESEQPESQYAETKIADKVENIADSQANEEKSANQELQLEKDKLVYDEEPNNQQAINVAQMLDTDTESMKQDTKISNDSDFDFSNS